MIRLAIQKSGRLSEKSKRLLLECGIKINSGNKILKSKAENFPIEVYYLRDDDIPQYVAEKAADIGIVGKNLVAEKQMKVKIEKYLGFGKCKISLAVKRELDYSSIQWFQNKRVATSYPNILSSYFAKNNINADIEVISGSVEIAPGIGLADGICDIVSTGSTLLTNGLKEVETIMKSEATLIANEDLDEKQKNILTDLCFRIDAVIKAEQYKYILLNAPNDVIEQICEILPGMRSPTVLPLAEKNWSSVHTVIREDKFWEVIGQLKKIGAQGILVTDIEKLIL